MLRTEGPRGKKWMEVSQASRGDPEGKRRLAPKEVLHFLFCLLVKSGEWLPYGARAQVVESTTLFIFLKFLHVCCSVAFLLKKNISSYPLSVKAATDMKAFVHISWYRNDRIPHLLIDHRHQRLACPGAGTQRNKCTPGRHTLGRCT